ncbi:hypothetical protein DFH08DRAFT_820948 [Mycena albidolilacea]|uniref:CCHC-type domain-containing protein n=1 Tax=Mycena albidolilacea TaxID=1033008 RepID=A0AAD6ZBA2_9AGAR|nr:hypothetical protein DFH08DRAFT_820948 [Mycena albidolilacea]
MTEFNGPPGAQNRAARRSAAGVTAGGTGDTFGEDEEEEPDSEDDYQVPEPPTAGGEVPHTVGDAQAIFALIKDMEPASQQLFLNLMMKTKGGDSGTVPGGSAVPAGTAQECPAAILRIFNAAAVQPARGDENSRPPFSLWILELAAVGIYLERSIFTSEHILDMFVNQSNPKYQPKKCTILNDEGKTVTVYTLDPSIFEDETTLSHIRFDEAHANYRRWFLENAPSEAVGQLESYNNHRQKCRDVNLVDEKDFLMVQQWCRSWMQRQAWKPTTWDEGIYHKEFEANRTRYFENKVAGQMAEIERHLQRQHREPHDRQGLKSTYPECTPSLSHPERLAPYPCERYDRDQQCSFCKDSQLCLKCGDTRHMAWECRASKTIKGGPTKIFFEVGKIFWVSDLATQVDSYLAKEKAAGHMIGPFTQPEMESADTAAVPPKPEKFCPCTNVSKKKKDGISIHCVPPTGRRRRFETPR